MRSRSHRYKEYSAVVEKISEKMWESEKLFGRKVFGEVMAIEEKTKKNLSIDVKRLPH